MVIDFDATRIAIVEPHEQFYNSRFAASGVTHQGDFLTWFYGKTNVLNGIFSFDVGKKHTFKVNRTLDICGGQNCVGFFLHIWNRVNNFEQPVAGCQRVLQHVVDGMQLIDRRIKKRQIADKSVSLKVEDRGLVIILSDDILGDTHELTHEKDVDIEKKTIEQFRTGKFLFGKDGAFAPLLKSFLGKALEVEMEGHLDEQERLKGNKRNGKCKKTIKSST